MKTRNKLHITVGVAALALLHILVEYINGGVVTHYLLADSSNPGISNWWGLLTLPLLTWAVLQTIEIRNAKTSTKDGADGELGLKKAYLAGGLCFGLSAALLWELGQEGILQYVILLPWVLSPFLRIYYPETTLGLVLGMTYTFGGVLPILFAAVIQAVGFLMYWVFNRGARWLLRAYGQ